MVDVGIFLWHKPGEELGEGEPLTAERLRQRAAQLQSHLQQVAAILEKLGAAGWSAATGLYDVRLTHPRVTTANQALDYLAKLGVDPDGVYIDEFDEGEEGLASASGE
jgi:hypothetical protein